MLPESEDPRTVEAQETLENAGLCEVVTFEDPRVDPRFDAVAAHIHKRRQAKGISEADARLLAAKPLHFAASLVALGHADASVAGATHTTAEVIRAGIHCVGTAPGIPVVSSMFLLVKDGSVMSYADCGVLPDPDPNQLAAIAAATAQNHQLFTGETPRVAFLSFSTKGSASHARVDKVRHGLTQFQQRHPGILCDGELQFDAAFVPKVAAKKAPDSPLKGNANVFVFPDLDSGNIAYKITQRLGGYQAFGPLTQGLAKPCIDLSRGCTAEDIVNVAVLASVMSSK